VGSGELLLASMIDDPFSRNCRQGSQDLCGFGLKVGSKAYEGAKGVVHFTLRHLVPVDSNSWPVEEGSFSQSTLYVLESSTVKWLRLFNGGAAKSNLGQQRPDSRVLRRVLRRVLQYILVGKPITQL